MRIVVSLLIVLVAWNGVPAGALAGEEGGDFVVARASQRDVVLTGFTRARASLPMVAETAGRVLAVDADVGDVIEPAGEFARIDPTFIQLDLDSNRIGQERLRSQIDYDSREAKRYRTLERKGSASHAQLDALEQSLRDNRFQLRALEVEEKVLEERLRRTRVAAPPGWLVTARQVEPGQLVSSGQVLGTVSDFSLLLVPFALTPGQLASVERAGDRLQLSLPDLSRSAPARIYRLNPAFDPETRKIAVDLSIAADFPSARGGIRSQLVLQQPEQSGTLSLPVTAVEQRYGEYWLTRADGRRVRVALIGRFMGSDGEYLRVTAPDIRAGERFRVHGE